MDRFVAGDRPPSSPKRSEILTRVGPSLDRAVVLFQDVVKVLHRAMSAVLLQSTLGFELHNRRRITGVLVGVDDPRMLMTRGCGWFAPAKALARKRLAATVSTLAESKRKHRSISGA